MAPAGGIGAGGTRARVVLLAAAATLLLALIAVPASASAARSPRVSATAVGSGGAAATVDRRATKAAIRTMKDGGNAADAAVAAAAVLGVTEPFSSGIGGGGFMLVRRPNGRITAIDGREEAPAAMSPDSFFEDGEPLDFDPARYSGLSIGVPGTVATWDEALSRFGTYSLRDALKPGIKIAKHGFKVDKTFYEQTAENTEYFEDVPSTAGIYLDGDRTPRDVGSIVRNVDLAKAYGRIGRFGAGGFYDGPIAEAIADAAQDPPIFSDAEHTWRPGLITAEDIGAYGVVARAPTRVRYRSYDVWGMGPPSSGGSTVGEALNILEGYTSPGPEDKVEAFHHYLEASRYAFADRGAYVADPSYFPVPLRGLLSDGFAAERRGLITGEAADDGPVEPGDPYGDQPQGLAAGSGDDTEGVSTTHLTVVDRRGMIVSYTFTIESTGGSGIVVPGWGFLLNNELTDFDYDDPQAANAPAGGKRPRSSIAPTIVTQGRDPVLAVGSPGGSTIITSVLQILVERLDLGMTLPNAIAAPRVSQRNGETSTAEADFVNSAIGRALVADYGHEFEAPEPLPPGEIGAATGIEFLRKGRLRAAAEPVRRGGGSAMVVKRDRKRPKGPKKR